MHTKSRRLLSSLLFIVVILQAGASGGPLRLPRIFGDHMVLQRDLPVVIWGWADPGDEVTVQFAGQKPSARADDEGRWRVKLAPLEAAATGSRLTVRSDDETVAFADVLVGEVWLCSGQSNMEWTVANSNDAEAEIAKADHPTIRHIKIERVMLPEPVDDVKSAAGWQHCTSENAGSFTAVGYFFGRELNRELNVPIGLINSSWGGSNIEAFTSLEGFRQVPELKDIVDRIESSLPGHESYEKAVRETMARTRQWLSEANDALAEDRRVPASPALPDNAKPLLNWVDPANKHNAMISGLAPYRIRGSIWYQGESNHNDGMLYVKKTQALVAGWRRAWNQPELPHYYVQIAPYQYGDEDPTILPKFWEAQAAIEREVPHSGMVVIHDVGNTQDIHPRNKQAVGHRLAVLALAGTYGRDVVAGGPRFEKMTIEGDKVRVFFNRIGTGLVTSDGREPDFFEIAGENGTFVPAEAQIDGRTVVLNAPNVRTPCAIRYAWSKLAEPNLRNSAGFPVGAFRNGNIPERGLIDSLVPLAKGYDLVYSHDVGAAGTTVQTAAYRLNRADQIGAFDRVSYFLALRKADAPIQYVWVSMVPFTQDATKLGVPVASANASFRQWVRDMEVRTNVEGVKAGTGMRGYIEFWPNNYGPQNGDQIEGASDEVFDFGDSPGDPREGYGSMQIHNPSARQTVLAVNRWWDGAKADVGIGNSPEGNPDYTFRSNAGQYQMKRLMVLVRPDGTKGKKK